MTVSLGILVGKILNNIVDLSSICMIILWNHNRSHSPGIHIRRPQLLSISLIYIFIYGLLWSLDSEIQIPCGAWEFLDAAFYLIVMYVLLAQVIVIFFLTHKTLLAKAAKMSSFRVMNINEAKILHRKLQKVQILSKKKVVLLLCAVALIFHSVGFALDWVQNSYLLNSDKVDICYKSISFEINKYFAYAIGIVALVVLFYSKLKRDIYALWFDYFGRSLFWIFYIFFSDDGLKLIGLTDLQKQYYDVYLWLSFNLVFFFGFLMFPYLKFTRKNLKSNVVKVDPFLKTNDVLKTESIVSLLGDEKFFTAFQHFLEKELSVEHLMFWKDVQEYKNLQCSQESKDVVKNHALCIYTTYLSEQSVLQVNVSHEVFAYYSSLNWDDQSIYEYSLFDDAEIQVLQLLKNDSLQRFRKSEDFKILMQSYRSENEDRLLLQVVATETNDFSQI